MLVVIYGITRVNQRANKSRVAAAPNPAYMNFQAR